VGDDRLLAGLSSLVELSASRFLVGLRSLAGLSAWWLGLTAVGLDPAVGLDGPV